MKGLMIKDFRLMFRRKRSFIFILLCGFIVNFSTDAEFFVGWLMLIGSLFALSTIAYDEHDNCYPFLMTLPITRKGYVIEKYLFGMLSGAAFWLIGVVFYAITVFLKGSPEYLSEKFLSFLELLLIPLLLLDFTIPINLKYGSEKVRLVMIIIWGAAFGVAFVVNRLIPGGVRPDAFISSLSTTALTVFAILVAVAFTGLSVHFSMRIISKKEF
jgi:ABC-2 type transport system permease protein